MYREFDEYVIRDWENKDVQSISKYANNRKIAKNLRDGFPNPYSIKDAESFISGVLDSDPITVFAIANKSEAIGSIGLMFGNDVHRYSAELGYWLAESFWSQGIMTKAVKSLTDYALNELEMIRVFAEPYCTNLASKRVLEKAGYTFEGIMRSNVYKDGKVLDQFLYSYIAKASK